MKLSIITITYNAEKVLERTVKSILGQTEQQFEYIIIDGASSDGTLKIAANFKVPHVFSEPDQGIYDAMNKGLSRATGDYVWFMNAGDEVHDPQVVAKLYKAMQSQADIYYSDTMVVNEDGRPKGLRSVVTPHQLPTTLSWQAFKYGMLVCHQSFIVKRSMAPKYILSHPYSADIDWEIQCLKRSKSVQYLPFTLSKYLTGGFSVKNLRASLWDRFIILKKHFGFWATLYHHAFIFWRGFLFAFHKKGRYW